jgi:methylthioribose-1-phosphate isomerase
MSSFETLNWKDENLVVIDQRYIPIKEDYVTLKNLDDAHYAIKEMLVRGAPVIGFTAIFGMALFAKGKNGSIDHSEVVKAGEFLKSARPTAVNLEYEVERCYLIAKEMMEAGQSYRNLFERYVSFAHEQLDKIGKDNQKMAELALDYLDQHHKKDKYRVMTICNTGALACGPMGTALGVITHMHSVNRLDHVFATETRPYQQGVRLTSFELMKAGIDHEVSVEGAFSYILENQNIDAIYAGADRIAANGDTANKIGTSTLSIIAKHYGVPFFIVAPTSSFDTSIESGDDIPIELRDENEILSCQGVRVAPEGARAYNPSFDIARAELITGIFCEKGGIHPVTKENVDRVVRD